MTDLKHTFRPEFLNRIDEIIVFHSLTKEHMKKIVGIMTKELQHRCKEQLDLELKLTDAVKQYIVDKAYDPKYGARPLRRMIRQNWRMRWQMSCYPAMFTEEIPLQSV